ncbi:hypothetical protein METUNv1_00284 [Methyloversatilis universalis FAM5]|jgi:hypothetical protein|uniref:Ice-binding protein C-terminal domain-containing protein n=1 Tax=Methyloversatilis universalis (strain ATCC BAA-1314 / DSM 25237 / JCM 13912 / CCUG 52030 / FAM5) TaxID=1000565 RepID=F5R7S6_METUF|nr:FxDxF family PEP-CTERM protein [Methyloversatilis universalis]EGK73113.1 hypothetical protein METUNv1_00284 [Methyloversatilis universalis FAM5]
MKKTVIAASLALMAAAGSAQAGDFFSLPTNLSTLTPGNGGLINGATNPAADRLHLDVESKKYLDGYDDDREWSDDPELRGSGNVVATEIIYNAVSGGITTATGTLTLLDWRVTTGVPLLPDEPQATIYDFVYRDSRDNALVFGTRYLNLVDNNQEVNFLYRYGFTGYSTAAAWTFLTDSDLRQYQAGATSSTSSSNLGLPYDPDTVRQRGDFSVSEGNPWSGLFLVKTNATAYTLGNKAIGYFQAGEEGQSPAGGFIGGFVPTAPVPEPETYALMLAGLGLIGLAARRRAQRG